MARFKWREFLHAAENIGLGHVRVNGSVAMTARTASVNSMRCALVAIGMALAWISLLCGDSWVTVSPIFDMLGGAVTIVFLTACLVAGAVLWLFTGQTGLCRWAFQGMPFGAQPYRSAAGLLLFFLSLAFYLDQVPGVQRMELGVLLWMNRLLWTAAVVAWIVGLSIGVAALK